AFALYDEEQQTVVFRRVFYDLAGAQNAILSAGLPQRLAERLATGR
ncbi:MAG: metallophosphoesterase, partial [Rhodospirillales bacterium]|nr:metallophosphoesterase [Acetobacter sp.]